MAGVAFHSIGDPRLSRTAERFGRLHWAWQGVAVFAAMTVIAWFGLGSPIDQAFIYYKF